MRSHLRLIGPALSTLLCLLLLPPALLAQEDEYVPEEAEQAEAPEEGSGLADDVDFGAIDDLLAADEEVLSDPGTYSYEPGARRDPFRSLLRRRSQNDETPKERPEGKPGLLIDELQIQGIFVLQDGPVAQVEAANSDTSYLLSPGDELWDGDVVRITMEEVVFKQSVRDPTALKPFREVVKKLNPGKR